MGRLRVPVALLVALVWAAVYLRATFDPKFNAPPEISGIMLAVVTGLFGEDIRQKIIGNKKGE